MKIINVSHTDWARFQWDNMNALRSVGIHCDSITLCRHEFYQEQSEIVSDTKEIIRRIADYDVIQFFHDNLNLFDLLVPAMIGKKIIVYHTSSFYRANADRVNANMNPYVYKIVNAMPEFMGMGARNEVYMVGAVDTDRIKPGGWVPNERPVFAHYPSNANVKGTAKIVELMSRTPANFLYSTDIVGYQDQLARMNMCDVYIEMFTDKDGLGSAYGDFGITALEAAAMGKVVMTNSKHHSTYFEAYSIPFFWMFNSEAGFLDSIRMLNTGYHSKEGAQEARELVVKNHSYKATGDYFLKNVL